MFCRVKFDILFVECGFKFKEYGQYSRFDGSETFDATFVEMYLD